VSKAYQAVQRLVAQKKAVAQHNTAQSTQASSTNPARAVRSLVARKKAVAHHALEQTPEQYATE